MKEMIYALCLYLFLGCSGKGATEQTGEKSQESPKSATEQVAEDSSDDLREIPLYSKCTNYDNNLSTVASKVEFVLVDFEPPINDFHIYNIELSDDCIFLSSLNFINQYDSNGKYIKNIGCLGQGPAEYINISSSLQLDRKNKLIYVTDMNRQRVVVYNFDGKFERAFPAKDAYAHRLIDSSTIAVPQSSSDRQRPESKFISFVDYNGKETRRYRSHYFPIKKMESFGPEPSFLWENKGVFYYLEYGADTIFQIVKDSVIPVRVLTGNLKPKLNESFQRKIGGKLRILSYMMRFNAGIFESDQFIIFKLSNDYESYYKIYNKSTGQFHRTKNFDPSLKRSDMFTDDMVSGILFNPHYQSYGKAIALVSALDIVENREKILKHIADHPSEEGNKLKPIIQKMTDDDNALMMMVTFK